MLHDLVNLVVISRVESKTKMSSLTKGFKTFSFLVLLIIVTWQYAIEIYGKFINDSKTFVSKTIDAETFVMPPITICMDNALKPSVLHKVAGHFNSEIFNPKPEIYIQSAPNNSNETYTLMCLGRTGHFGQH